MSSHASSEQHDHPNYMAIFVILFLLTVSEVAIAYFPKLRVLVVTILVVVGLIKAALVALYYMHLRTEGKLIYATVCVPIVFAVIIMVAIFTDINVAKFSAINVAWSQIPSEQPGAEAGGHGGGHAESSSSSSGGSVATSTTTTSTTSTASTPAAADGTSSAAAPAAPGEITVRYYKGAPNVDYLAGPGDYKN